MQNLKPKLGSLGIMFHQSSRISSFSHHQESQSGLIKNPDAGSRNRPTHFTIWRSEHFKAEKQLDCKQNSGECQVLNFPGGNVKFTSELDFLPESLEERVHCYRILDENGQLPSGNFVQTRSYGCLSVFRYQKSLPLGCILTWPCFRLWIPFSMRLKDKEEYPSMSLQWEKRQ